MDALEKKGKEILRRELGHFYEGQSYEEFGEFHCFSGFYLKTCQTVEVGLKSDLRNHYSQLYIEKAKAKNITVKNETVMKLVELDKKANALLDDNLWCNSDDSVKIKDLRDHLIRAYRKMANANKIMVKGEVLKGVVRAWKPVINRLALNFWFV